jgi:serine/threonine protein kinase
VSPSLEQQVQAALGDAYVLERELGGGGMSRVFLAHETALGRKVVIKVLLPELAAGVSVDRFRREIQLAAQLQHPHIVPLLSAGEAEGLPYFIMPFVTGESLRARVARDGELPIAETVRILRDVVSALVFAHARGVVHRDIKPDNVLLSGGVAVVTDFGVAKAVSVSAEHAAVGNLTSLGVALGTPAYMAPEQATASPSTDHRADIYALGAMAYEMLTGSPPFAGRSPQAVLAAHVVEEPPSVETRRPAVPPMLANLVRECLAKRPADRPQAAAEVMYALDAIATPTGGTVPTTAVIPVSGRPLEKARNPWLIGSVATLAILAIGIVLWRGRTAPSPPPTPAMDEQARANVPAADTAPSVSRAAPAPTPDQPPTTADQPAAAPPVTPQAPARKPAQAARRSEKPKQQRPAPAETTAAVVPDERPAAPAAVPPPQVAETTTAPAPQVNAPAPAPARAPTAAPAPAPTPPPVDPTPEIRRVIGDYSNAIEAKSLADLRRVYPSMTSLQQRGWEQFFQIVRDVDAKLSVGQLDVDKDTAGAQVTGTYTYRNTSTGRTEQQPVAFHASLKKTAGQWLISQIR